MPEWIINSLLDTAIHAGIFVPIAYTLYMLGVF